VAIKAALTGHLVFSTLHTNSAASVITRLLDMQVERYLIAATLRLAVAQRLVRKLCPRCRRPRPLGETEAAALGTPEKAGSTVYDAQGCMYCANRGFIGRIGVFEMLAVDEELAREIAAGAEEPRIIEWTRARKAARLIDDVMEKLVAGQTTVGEALAAVTVW
jgi:type II secretory ATPase GspE/PulE/Tfp pilus assembly ATPase PilB-like protein